MEGFSEYEEYYSFKLYFQAINKVRMMRPGSVETRDQEKSLEDFEKCLKESVIKK